MPSIVYFGEVLEAADQLSLEEQEYLMEILSRRLRERRRAKIAKNIQKARQEYQQGLCQAASPNEIMKDILS